MVKAMKTRVGNPLRKLVLIKLADNANDHGECWPSYQHIADQCEMSRSSVKNHINARCLSGLIVKEERFGGRNGQTSNLYVLNLDVIASSLMAPSVRSWQGGGQELAGGGAGAGMGGGAGAAPRTSHSLEPVNEPLKANGAEAPPAQVKPANHAFETAWKHYPKREGSNPKNKALQAWNARIAEGVTPEEIMSGLVRYIGFCDAKGQTGSPFVMQAARFFGPGREFENEWSVSDAPVRKGAPRNTDDDTSWILDMENVL